MDIFRHTQKRDPLANPPKKPFQAAVHPGRRANAPFKGRRQDQPPVLHNADEAKLRAVELTGLKKIRSAKLIKLAESGLPFLSTLVDNQPAWEIRFTQTRLTGKLKTTPDSMPDQYERNFVLWLSPTGDLISLHHCESGPCDRVASLRTTANAEAVLRARKEIYLWFPSKAPKMKFIEALDRVRIGHPCNAKEIEACCVELIHGAISHKLGLDAPKLVWIITLRGLTPFRNGVTQYRNIIDDATGKLLYATSWS